MNRRRNWPNGGRIDHRNHVSGAIMHCAAYSATPKGKGSGRIAGPLLSPVFLVKWPLGGRLRPVWPNSAACPAGNHLLTPALVMRACPRIGRGVGLAQPRPMAAAPALRRLASRSAEHVIDDQRQARSICGCLSVSYPAPSVKCAAQARRLATPRQRPTPQWPGAVAGAAVRRLLTDMAASGRPFRRITQAEPIADRRPNARGGRMAGGGIDFRPAATMCGHWLTLSVKFFRVTHRGNFLHPAREAARE